MRIIETIQKHSMFAAGERVIVAVSGGPDSVALFYALHIHAAQLGIHLHICHVNHCLRADESNSDEEFTRKLAHNFDTEITVARIDISKIASESKRGIEETARAERYKFFNNTATNIDARRIAVGHTSDDRAETALINIFRGTGIDGIGSIRPVRGNIVRPLIETTRAEVMQYIAENGLSYRTDSSNYDTVYTRNLVRREILPMVEESINPDVKAALVRLADIASAQSDAMEEIAKSAQLNAQFRNRTCLQTLRNHPVAVQRAVIRLLIKEKKGDLTDIGFDSIERILTEAEHSADFKINLPTGELWAVAKDGLLSFETRPEPYEAKNWQQPVCIPGTTGIEALNAMLNVEIVDAPSDPRLSPCAVYVPKTAISGTLICRNARPGDRIQPFGMKRGSKKLQDVFTDKKIPPRERARAIVVCDDEKIIWVAGIIASEHCRVISCNEALYLLTIC